LTAKRSDEKFPVFSSHGQRRRNLEWNLKCPALPHRLASIAARDPFLVLSTCHSFPDGVGLLWLKDAFLRGKVTEWISTLPIPLEAGFQNELFGPIDVIQHIADVGKRSSLSWARGFTPTCQKTGDAVVTRSNCRQARFSALIPGKIWSRDGMTRSGDQ
jgi:hypothetical protein